jgi:hypothetical protein
MPEHNPISSYKMIDLWVVYAGTRNIACKGTLKIYEIFTEGK